MNAPLEQTYDSALAFAPNMGQLDSSAATTSYADVADVFARRERQSTVFFPEFKRRIVHIQVGDRRGVVTYPGSGAEPQPWLAPVLRSLSERWGVKPGWDSYDAKPTDVRHAARLLTYLFELMGPNSTPPTMTPLWDGGVQATWHRNSNDLEIVVSADEPPTYFFRDAATGHEEEKELAPNLARLRALISQF
jgi:hypothetical protein